MFGRRLLFFADDNSDWMDDKSGKPAEEARRAITFGCTNGCAV